MTTPPPAPRILIDTREQCSLPLPDTFATQRISLATGDYSIDGLTWCLAIERKSHADAWQAVLRHRRRFKREVERLASLAAAPIDRRGFAAIVIECTRERLWMPPTPRHDARRAAAVANTYTAWADAYGVAVVYCDGRDAAAEWLAAELSAQWERLHDIAGDAAEAVAHAFACGVDLRGDESARRASA